MRALALVVTVSAAVLFLSALDAQAVCYWQGQSYSNGAKRDCHCSDYWPSGRCRKISCEVCRGDSWSTEETFALLDGGQSSVAVKTQAQPQFEEFSLPNVPEWVTDQEMIKNQDVKALGTRSYVDWIKYSWLRCAADWDNSCAGDLVIDAPPGWQACKLLYAEAHKHGNASYNPGPPTSWYTNDPESPDRFRAYNLSMRATGNGNPIDRQDAAVQLNNVGLRLIPADANNSVRYSTGCDMPRHD